MNLNLKMKKVEDWIALGTLLLVVINVAFLIVGIPLALTQPYSTRMLAEWGISTEFTLRVVGVDLLLTIIWYILFKIYKKHNR